MKSIELTEAENITLYDLLNQYFDCLEESEQEIILSIMKKL